MLASTSHQASARALALALPGQVRVGLTRSEPVPRVSSGVAQLDTLLGGGLPRGRISELCGPRSSGKTSLVLSLLAAATLRGEVVACVDLPDALHPESVALAGADLQRLLWVRPGSVTDALRCTELLLQAGGFAIIVLDLGDLVPRPLRPFVWPRLLRAVEQSHAAFVVSAPQRIAGSSAVLSLGLQRRTSRWQLGAWPLFDGFDIVAEIQRSKLDVAEAKSIQLKTISQILNFQR